MRKKGISMVALVITIIVLIVLTSAVVITGVGVPKQAQLAAFYNNLDTVQELVSLTMGNNMITAELEGKDDNYKWVDIIEGCDAENWSTSGVVTFGTMVTGLDKNVARISPTLLEKTSLPTTEIGKYYVDNNGVVYYQGFEYEGQTLYTKGTVTGDNNTPIVVNPTDGSYNPAKGVNSPKLMTGMKAVYWEGNEEITSDNPNFEYNNWYDYTIQTGTTENGGTSHWANAKTEDGSYWVWIPRYAYSITSNYHNGGSGVVGTIDIEFLKDKTNISTTGRTQYQNACGANNWNVHPAFHYDGDSIDGTQLAGIWVAKYKTTNVNGNVAALPGKNAWRSISFYNCFTKSKEYNTAANSHLLKNIEWGALMYLAHSKYGRNTTQITVNATTYSAGGQNATPNANVLQSTTGNCYGVYDIKGGEWEYVAAGLQTSMISILGTNNAKYYNGYDQPISTTDYGKNNGILVYGDAIYETSLSTATSAGSTDATWFGEVSEFAYPSEPIFLRGAFTFGVEPDYGWSNVGFRMSLWCE